jgi:ABC-2 type transport system permease protein
VSSTLSTQVYELARRSVARTLRQPAVLAPSIVFPLVLLAVNAGGLSDATSIPGFPADSYLDFALAITFMQGALFAASNSGTDLARDIETGFINRLALTPMRGSALLVGHLAGAVALGLIQGLAFLVVGLLAGGALEAGVAGALVILALVVLMSLGFGAIGAAMALRTGSGEAVQGLFPLLFVLLFLSSMSLPRNLIEIGWFRAVATANPVSYLIEALRSLFISGWDPQALALGFGFATAIAVLGVAAAGSSLRTRMARS